MKIMRIISILLFLIVGILIRFSETNFEYSMIAVLFIIATFGLLYSNKN